MAGALQGAGAEVLAIACNTAHAYADLIQRASGLPLIDMIETGGAGGARDGARRAGVLGTGGALELYREYLAARAMGPVTLDAGAAGGLHGHALRIKGGDTGRGRPARDGRATPTNCRRAGRRRSSPAAPRCRW